VQQRSAVLEAQPWPTVARSQTPPTRLANLPHGSARRGPAESMIVCCGLERLRCDPGATACGSFAIGADPSAACNACSAIVPRMTPSTRRTVQAILYEVVAIAFIGPILSIAFDTPASSTIGLAFVLSSIALGWNYVFNTLFERWESRQSVQGRSLARRLAHGLGFEGGLVVILLPVMALWLEISLTRALMANLGLLAFFFVYAIAFTWAFDRVFGLPESAAKRCNA
jgi:uncharacterized membrane protein